MMPPPHKKEDYKYAKPYDNWRELENQKPVQQQTDPRESDKYGNISQRERNHLTALKFSDPGYIQQIRDGIGKHPANIDEQIKKNGNTRLQELQQESNQEQKQQLQAVLEQQQQQGYRQFRPWSYAGYGRQTSEQQKFVNQTPYNKMKYGTY
ncbi:MAG: hypothetical protein EZS28_055908 [Streblomastix strix]|uniref:Uncharacterized protein n=1 Tax=Streblomastix strix TaxID=222440 RepID=A0A5J4PV29_9EUKA|nr:MAG: hypothetical protein EZS28_055908 [Streblomastix strix]